MAYWSTRAQVTIGRSVHPTCDLPPMASFYIADSKERQKPRPLLLRAHQDTGQDHSFRQNNQAALQFRPPTLTPIESSDDDDDAVSLWNNPVGATHVQEALYEPHHSLFTLAWR